MAHDDVNLPRLASGSSTALPTTAAAVDHAVHFYEREAQLGEAVAQFLAEGLSAGESAVVIATPEHGAGFERRLAAAGIDVPALRESGRFTLLDAEATLAAFMAGAAPDPRLFRDVVGKLVRRQLGRGRLRTFGEMVDLLWRRGNREGAIQLEGLWNEVCREPGMALLCAYEMGAFVGGADGFERICASHSTVTVPGGDAETLAGNAYRSLLADIARRTETERSLRASLDELIRRDEELRASERSLRAVTDALPTLISQIDRDGYYRFVNASYERWFGRCREDIVGRHIGEVLGAEAYERLKPNIEAVLAGKTFCFEAELPYQYGGTRTVEATYVPVRGEAGEVTGYAALVADISERKRQERARAAVEDRSRRLMRVTAAIADAITEQEVYEAIVDRVSDAVQAATAGLWRLDEAGEVAMLVRARGYAEASMESFASARVDGAFRFPVLDAIRRGEPLYLGRAELFTAYPELAPAIPQGDGHRVACLPLIAQGRALGGLALSFDGDLNLESEARDVLLLIGRYAGQALERLRLLDAERRSRERAENVAARMEFLSRASRRFVGAAESMVGLLDAIVRDLTAEFADGAGLMLLSAGRDELRLAALHTRDPEAEDMARSLLADAPVRVTDGARGTAAVARTGVPLLMNHINAQLARATAAPQLRPWVERHRPSHAIIVPLRARGEVIGTLTALRNDARPFTDEDQELLQNLADRAGTAIVSSRLQHDNREGRIRAELLYRMARAVIGADGVDEVYEAALEGLERALGASRAAILSYDDDGVMRFRAWRGLSDDYRAAVEGHSPWSPDVRDPAPVVVPDVEADASVAAFLPVLRAEHIRGLAFIPLVAEGSLIGKFMAYYDAPAPLGEPELEMASAIANHVAAAMSRFATMAELQRTVRFNEMFTGILGHDLRTPLGAITAAAQLLMRCGEGEHVQRPLARILMSGERMARMIDQLLDFTRVRVGEGIPLSPARYDLAAIARDVVDELYAAHPESVLRLEHVGDTVGQWDADRLLQVLSNVVANAVQHGEPEHGVKVSIDGRDDRAVELKIHNMGAIPPSLVPGLFEPMAGGVRRRDGSQGLGLGLYISREIVRAHGGSIAVTSDLTGGTTFTLILPRVIPPPRQG